MAAKKIAKKRSTKITAVVMTPGEQALFHEIQDLRERVVRLEAAAKKATGNK